MVIQTCGVWIRMTAFIHTRYSGSAPIGPMKKYTIPCRGIQDSAGQE